MMEIRITSGDYKGRYIGLPVGNSGGTNLAKKNTPVNVPGTSGKLLNGPALGPLDKTR
jgi:hypothetical protein